MVKLLKFLSCHGRCWVLVMESIGFFVKAPQLSPKCCFAFKISKGNFLRMPLSIWCSGGSQLTERHGLESQRHVQPKNKHFKLTHFKPEIHALGLYINASTTLYWQNVKSQKQDKHYFVGSTRQPPKVVFLFRYWVAIRCFTKRTSHGVSKWLCADASIVSRYSIEQPLLSPR